MPRKFKKLKVLNYVELDGGGKCRAVSSCSLLPMGCVCVYIIKNCVLFLTCKEEDTTANVDYLGCLVHEAGSAWDTWPFLLGPSSISQSRLGLYALWRRLCLMETFWLCLLTTDLSSRWILTCFSLCAVWGRKESTWSGFQRKDKKPVLKLALGESAWASTMCTEANELVPWEINIRGFLGELIVGKKNLLRSKK